MPLFTFESYADCSNDLQFITVAVTLALVLATSAMGAAVDKSVRSSCASSLFSCKAHLESLSWQSPSCQTLYQPALSHRSLRHQALCQQSLSL